MITHAGFPERHQRAMQDPADPIHRACDFLVEPDLTTKNEYLHSTQVLAAWPGFLVAFASQGCGDYFAYDMRESPPSVIYIDPDDTPEDNLAAPDAIRYTTFDDWYEAQLERHTCQHCGSREVRFVASQDKRWLLRVCPSCGSEDQAERIDP